MRFLPKNPRVTIALLFASIGGALGLPYNLLFFAAACQLCWEID